MPHFDRLSALDASFLDLETECTHMHVAAVLVFDGGSLVGPQGNVDIDRIRLYLSSVLHRIPRYRQKLVRVPILEHPVWVDDARFNVEYHVRHTRLPHPGNVALLKQLAGHIMSQKLDRTKPLWEFWIVEGLEDHRFAVVVKAHHCMVDGISGIDLLLEIARFTDDASIESAMPWQPQPPPRWLKLLGDEVRHRSQAPRMLMQYAWDAMTNGSHRGLRSVGDTARNMAGIFAAGFSPAARTPLNVEIGPHRRFDWLRLDLGYLKSIKRVAGGTLNDIVLALVCGAIRRFLLDRGFRIDGKTFRALVPVSTRTAEQRGAVGNRIATLLAALPIDQPEPRRRLEQVIRATTELKRSGQAAGVKLIEDMADRLSPWLLARLIHLAIRTVSYNVVVTNVPGPQVPTYLLGARLVEIYPLVPLYQHQALGVALFSYNGGLFWGLNADFDAVPDLASIRQGIETALDELCAAFMYERAAS